jgi:hypothetical protein
VSLVAVHGVTPGAGSQRKRLLAAVWIVYVVGAMAAAAAMEAVTRLGLVLPVLAVLTVVGIAAARYWHAPGA